MAEFARKSMMGYAAVRGGHSDPDCTHVILTKREYDQILREKDQASRDAAIERANAQKSISAAERAADCQVNQVKAAAAEEASMLKDELEKARQEGEYQRQLNENLLRISRERANADRKLKPKKQHTGYVVVLSTEKNHRYRVNRKDWDSVVLWETVIQSPYSVEFTADQARHQIMQELFPKDKPWEISRIGINGRYKGEYADMLQDKAVDDDFKQRNISLSRLKSFRANYRTGFWELVITHTKPLTAVPEDMRAC